MCGVRGFPGALPPTPTRHGSFGPLGFQAAASRPCSVLLCRLTIWLAGCTFYSPKNAAPRNTSSHPTLSVNTWHLLLPEAEFQTPTSALMCLCGGTDTGEPPPRARSMCHTDLLPGTSAAMERTAQWLFLGLASCQNHHSGF